jgi:signal transduction histidine kinase
LQNQNAVTILLSTGAVLAGWLTYMVINRFFKPVLMLTESTDEVMRGNLDLHLEVKTGDELEVLADRFAVMAAALKEQRLTLEKKVLERTRALEESQREETERQKEVLKLKDEFLFVAAHELRTPLSSIRWSLESVADREMDPDLRQAFEDALKGSKNLATLVEDLLNMARLDSKRIPFKKEFVNTAEIAHTIIKQMSPIADKKKIRLTFEAPEGIPIMALADAKRVQQVLINLISNSIKYNKVGGHVSLTVSRDGDYVAYDVIDDGPGIPPEEQHHLFEKFWRSKHESEVEGSGLGLFITKRLVDGMNGKISCESVPNVRTDFKVSLPIAKS